MKRYYSNTAKDNSEFYVGSAIYQTDTIVGNPTLSQLKYMMTDEGRLSQQADGEFAHEYMIKDHLGNTRVLFGDYNGNDSIEDSEILQQAHYYPFGMAFTGYDLETDTNKFLYNGKELQTDGGLGWYDYGARFYDPSLGRWHCIDNLAEKYPGLTSYHYTANNPIKFVDYDGQDYGVNFDHENKTVTVSATYYAAGADDVASAQQAAGMWNGESGNYTYTVGKGDDAVTYTVNFEVSVVEVDIDASPGKMGSLNQALGNDKTGTGNVYTVVPDADMKKNTNGSTIGGNFIKVKDSQKTANTGAHEMGHTLGLGHTSKGIMTSTSTSSARSNNSNRSDAKDMVKYPMKGKANYVTNSDGNKAYAGEGTVTNSTPYVNVCTDWGGQQRTYAAPDNLNKGKVK